jgi:hypothetical protein
MRGRTAAVLAGIAAAVAAVAAQPDPRQMSGQPLPSPDLPGGVVSVRVVRGALTDNVADQTVEAVVGGVVRTAVTDAGGRAQFLGVSPGATIVVRTTLDGARLESQTFTMPPSGGVRLMLVGAAGASQPEQPGEVVFGPNSRIVVEVVDEAVQIYYLLQVRNGAGAPVRPAAPLILDLPAGAQSPTLLEGSQSSAALTGPRLTLIGPFPPGESVVNVAYQLPVKSSRLSVVQSFPAELQQVGLVVEQPGNLRVQSPAVAQQQEATADGRRFILAVGGAWRAGAPLSFDLEGLPYAPRTGLWIASVISLGIVAVGTLALVRGSGPAAGEPLQRRRDRLLDELVALERGHRAGRIAADRYHGKREALVRQLETVYARLDGERPAA